MRTGYLHEETYARAVEVTMGASVPLADADREELARYLVLSERLGRS